MADKSFLSWPFFEDHHREFALALDAWVQQHIAPLPHSHDVDADCAKILALLAEGGWLTSCVPAEFGGRSESLDVRSLCLIRETLGRVSGLADFVFAMQGLGSGAITIAGSEDLKRRYLPDVASGKKVAAFALTEPASGSDVANIATSAVDMGDHYLVNGEKTFISNGGIADFYCLFVRTGEAPGARGLSALVVDADTPGFEVAERIEVIAPHPLGRITFTNMRVPKENLIGKAGDGFKISMGTLDIFRSTVGAASLGFARRAMDEAIARAKGRELFGAPMADMPLVQAHIADMAVDIDASALLIYRAAWTKDVQKTRVTREAAMAKLYATEAAQKVIDQAVQIWGGLGVTSGITVETLYREIRALRIYEGASDVQKLVIARQTLAD
ncbi:acyl-CoA dehydrogenase family protein [Govanella unica]|uniref:Acyl-CoA dehydrogenase family protein n=1 Tax=Govanella unica TaxID=2975056 RepID=A0A9X3TXW3_9PROT|nr:acyl-CoA dehydrogenase family protein [Govania unica]MDA5194001.1 acyl-CoA dehydrogenase family protein [Govania unica]